jgi:hypothetical protein
LCTHVYAENCEHRHDQDIIATSIKTLLPEATDNKPQNESKEGIIFFFSDSAIMQKLVDVLESDEQSPCSSADFTQKIKPIRMAELDD